MFVRLHLKRKKLGMIMHACHPREDTKFKTKELWSKPALAKSKPLPQKNNQSKKGLKVWLKQ
jgi:hypothetical protein